MPAFLIARVHRWSESRLMAGAILAAAAAGAVAVAVRDPARGGFPPCLFHAVTGLDCPGCGGLRAVHALLHGHPGAALGYDPLIPVAFPVLALFLYDRIRVLWGRPLPRVEISLPGKWGWTVPVAVLAFTVVRNLR